MKVVYAKVTALADSPSGIRGTVQHGTHWPADDPVVLAHPEYFSTDPRYGLNYSVEPEGYNAAEGSVVVEQATAAPGEKRQTRRG